MFNLSFMERSRNNLFSAPAAGRAEGPTAEGLINEIAVQVLLSIFLKAREELGRMACVNKRWNAIVYGEPLYKELYRIIDPTGRADWIAQNFGDPGEEPRIPLEWLAKIEIGNHLLTLVPKSVVKGNGEKIFITALSMGKMWAERMKFPSTQTQYRPGYTNDSMGEYIDEYRLAEETHWVWFKGNEVIGRDKTHQEQEAEVYEQGGEVSGLIDTIVTMLHAKTWKYFAFKWEVYKFTIYNRVFVRVQDTTPQGWDVTVNYSLSGLGVNNYRLGHSIVGVVAARKSFGH